MDARLPIKGLSLPIDGVVHVWIGLLAALFAIIVSPVPSVRHGPVILLLLGVIGSGEVASIVRISQIERATKSRKDRHS